MGGIKTKNHLTLLSLSNIYRTSMTFFGEKKDDLDVDQ
jgi:hypothetical protein